MLSSGEAGDLDTIRTHTSELIHSASSRDQPVLVEAPPNSGKTTTAYELALDAEKPITYLAGRTDLYDQAEKWSEQQTGVTWAKIPAPHRECPTFLGKNDGSKSQMELLYSKGYSGRQIHFLSPDTAYTPCKNAGCPYLETLDRIDRDVQSIDLLIGHHAHCNREQYVRDRIVIIDEFNPDPFLTGFPSDDGPANDDPLEIIPEFLNHLDAHDTNFPSDVFEDLTDIIQYRSDPSYRSAAIDWFREHGASRRAAADFEFLQPTTQRYDRTHLLAPFLTFSLLCMEKIGAGIELAPPPGNDLDEAWSEAGLSRASKCVRDRNTGSMWSLRPPPLDTAAQVIGLDGTPTIELWNLLFAPEIGFDHRQVIHREDYVTYLESGLNMSLTQIGGGMHNYAGGRMSERDRYRFEAIRARENARFALITTRKVLQKYARRGWLDQYVKRAPERSDFQDSNKLFDEYMARHYGIINSSNKFKEESLGVVAGSPLPGDQVVKIWAGLCGHEAISEGEGREKTFGEFGDRIFQHLTHNKIVQAILRFGRHKSIWNNGGATVYVSTHALPDWVEISSTLELRSHEKENAIIAGLVEVRRTADRPALAYLTLNEYADRFGDFPTPIDEVSDTHLREVLQKLVEQNLVSVRRDAGKRSADLYRWEGDNRVVNLQDHGHLVLGRDTVFVFQPTYDWKL